MAARKPVAIVVGASRGIGRQVAIDLAKNGYIVIVGAKTTSDATKCIPFPPDPNSQASTINTVAREITEANGEALALPVDTRNTESVFQMVTSVMDKYGRLDVLVYNSGAIWWASVEKTPMKRFRLMQEVNVHGLYASVQATLPHFYRNGSNGKGRIVVISPPIYSRFLRGKTGYAIGKWGMSALTMGLGIDFEREGRADMTITSLWPAAAIESAATQNPQTDRSQLRKPSIFSDAILAILRAPPAAVNGKCLLDEDLLREHEGMTDFTKYALVAGSTPRRIMPAQFPDLSVTEQGDEGTRMDSTLLRTAKL
ncbi:hypothetical protein BAUCODRAFT_561594 [Baudoinia panamericana UAMH 10762]|uniref:Uncharacterized protein n=1 Tax=Baudoinia panamericana (strain UAMH 10762) TaxID=717646 RepID=M2N6T1_BAUPA|nr:uncharacterized protein BAUCODRAFT_561594 [Baudoinia panamericana UAMH 10762]EMC94789.1 hypothetical protein BAUCODRAFT_561594 [Baudoinia panamericana UAMH 10762]